VKARLRSFYYLIYLTLLLLPLVVSLSGITSQCRPRSAFSGILNLVCRHLVGSLDERSACSKPLLTHDKGNRKTQISMRRGELTARYLCLTGRTTRHTDNVATVLGLRISGVQIVSAPATEQIGSTFISQRRGSSVCRGTTQTDWDFRTDLQFSSRQRWTASRSFQFTPDTHCTGGLVSSRSVLSTPTGNITHDFSQVQTVVQSVYRLRYPGYCIYILTKNVHDIYIYMGT
jgi:hypothetical protein